MIFLQLSDLTIQPFTVDVSFKGERYKLTVSQSRLSDQIEEFQATINKITIIIATNRPWVRLKGLRQKVIWKVIQPKLKEMIDTGAPKLVEEILFAIKLKIAQVERPPVDWSVHPKNQK